MSQQSSKASKIASNILATGMGLIAGGPVGAIVAFSTHLAETKLQHTSHTLTRATILTGLLTSAAVVFTGPIGIASTALVGVAAAGMAYATKDFLDVSKKVDQLSGNISNIYKTYASEHPAEAAMLIESPSNAIKAIIDNPFARNIASQQALNILKLGTNLASFYVLGTYAKGDFVITFLSSGYDNNKTAYYAAMECAGVLTILTLQSFLDTKISNMQAGFTRELKSEVEKAAITMVTDDSSVNKIIAIEGGANTLQHIPYVLANQMGLVSSDLTGFIERVINQLTALGIVVAAAPLLIPCNFVVAQASFALNKKINEQKSKFQTQKDKLASDLLLMKSHLSSNVINIFTSNLGKFEGEAIKDLMARESELGRLEQEELNSQAMQRIWIANAEKLCNILGFLASFYTSKLTPSQLPLLQHQIAEVNTLLSGGGMFTITYANENGVKLAMEALDSDLPQVVNISTNSAGRFNFKDFKLFIGDEERIHINGSVSPGQHIVLKGDSGLGKSTMIKALLGQKSPITRTEGVVEIPETSNGKNPILLVSQDVVLVPTRSLFENLVCKNKSSIDPAEILATKARIISLLDEMLFNQVGDLEDLLENNDLSLLSGGQKKKIALVRAILQDPKLLILDETFAGMDHDSLRAACRVLSKYLPEAIIVTVDHDGESNTVGFYHGILDLNHKPAKFVGFSTPSLEIAEEVAPNTSSEINIIGEPGVKLKISPGSKICTKTMNANGRSFFFGIEDNYLIVETSDNAGAEYHLHLGTDINIMPGQCISNITSAPDCFFEVHIHDGLHLVGVAAG